MEASWPYPLTAMRTDAPQLGATGAWLIGCPRRQAAG